jgi:hypothetical protein
MIGKLRFASCVENAAMPAFAAEYMARSGHGA